MKIDQAVVFAGGLGTRLRPFTNDSPKPMYPIQGHPFIEYLIKQIKSFGIDDIALLLGYLPDKIMDYLGDGSQYGVHITYRVTPVEYETGARLLEAKPVLADTFLMLYCDNYCPLDYERLCLEFERNDADIQMTAYANRDGYTKSNLHIESDGRVDVYDKKRVHPNLSGVDIGYCLVKKKVIDLLPEENVNFEAAVYPQLVKRDTLYATVCEHRYYSIGSYERIELTEQFFAHRICAFLDRDGTLNERPPRACYIEKPEDFIWLPGAKEAIKLLNEAGCLTVIVSNQPGIARGAMTEDDLNRVNAKMMDDLAADGAHLDAIYTCKHNWDDGCFCRKPSPGMLYQAQQDYSLNLLECALFGDDDRDIEAGQAARCLCYQIDSTHPLIDAVKAFLKTKGLNR